MRRSRIRLVAVAAITALALAACSSSSKEASPNTTSTTAAETSTTAAPTPSTATATSAKTVSLASSKFGQIMVDSKGMTLYVLERDTPGKSNCTGGCLTIWPAVVAPASPTYGAGLTASKFSVITRDDGTKQLAVNGSPLYLFASDTKAGDVNGQGVGGFYVVKADGTKYEQ
jgi:predicted lipoprotein with Yx(FWY)xxD motif